MIPAPLLADEADRLRVLHELHLLDASPEPRFDSFVRLLLGRLEVPMAWLGLVDETRVWLTSESGIGAREMPRDNALCAAVLQADDLLVVEDARSDPRIAAGAAADPRIRFYAAAPLTVGGQRVGVLAAAGPSPRRLSPAERQFLQDLAVAASAMLEAQHRERQLRLQNARLRAATLSRSDWLWETDAQGRVTWVSDTFEQHTGMAAESQVGRSVESINKRCAADYTGSWDRFMARRGKREAFENLIVERETNKGTLIVSTAGVPVFDSQGRFCGYRGAASNITEKFKARATEELLSAALESLAAGVMVCAPDGRVLYMNSHQRHNLRKLAVQDHWPTMVELMVATGDYPDAVGREAEFVKWRLGIVSELGEPHEMRWRGRWLIVSARRLSNGNVVHLSWEVTQRKEAELALAEQRAALTESQDKLRAVLDAVPDLWFVLDAQGRYLECGAPAHELLVQPWAQMKGRPFAESVPADVAARTLEAIANARLSGEVQRIEYMLQIGHASPRAFEARISPMAGERVLYVTRDLSDQRSAQQALRDKQAVELASQAKSEFLSRMSHEMRTPLNAVIGFSQLLKLDAERLDPLKLRTYVDHMLDAGQHLLALINDVLDLQKVEEGALALAMQPVALSGAVSRAVELLTPMADERGVRFKHDVPDDLWVHADAQRLRQVLLNLCSNAVKYNRPGGVVRVVAFEAVDGRIALRIEDTGAGMNADQMRRLFQPFERLGRETSSIEGTGLGLIIARSLMQAIGGSLDVTSQPGHGTQVTLHMQRDPAAIELDEAPADVERTDARRTPLRMLYVEDNRINALLFQEALRLHRGDIDLRIAEDGTEALEMASEWRPQVLVLDAHLPGLSGFEVLVALRALPGLATVPAYMCSADAMPDDVQRAYEAGFAGYWAKPIDINRVLSEIDHLRVRAPADTMR